MAKSQADYLKKYLTPEPGTSSRKRKALSSKKKTGIGISIVDDDTIVPLHDDEAELEEDLMPTEELPTIGGFLDERPTSVRELDKYRQSHRWRGLGDDEDEDADQDTESPALPSPRMEQKNKSQSSIKREPVVPAANTRSRVDSSDEEQRPTIKREPLSSTQSAVPSSVRSRIDADSDEEKGAPRPRSTTTGAKSAGARSRVDDSDEEPAVVKREKQPPARARIDNDSDEETPATTAPTVAISFKKRAGLMSRQEVSEDLRAARKQDTGIVDLTLIGKDAKTVVRKKPKEESEEERNERLEREAREALVKDKLQQLGKGLKQLADNRAARAELEDVADKPFARYVGDEDRDAYLKSQFRAGDPMAAFLSASASNADASSTQKKRYTGPEPPPNRYGIAPGYRWDGVDRSNGFERRFFEMQSGKKAYEEARYRWAVEEM